MNTQPQERRAAVSPAERRHSRRIQVVAPVVVTWMAADGRWSREYGHTVDVSRNGALLRVRRQLPIGQVVELAHGRALCWTAARVVRNSLGAASSEVSVGVELGLASDVGAA